jgi:hypothetical protein
MTDIFLSTVLIGAAVTYVLEILDAISMGLVSKSTINKVLSLPLSLGGVWVMQQAWDLKMLILVPSSTFISLTLIKLVNKPSQIQYQRLPRL